MIKKFKKKLKYFRLDQPIYLFKKKIDLSIIFFVKNSIIYFSPIN